MPRFRGSRPACWIFCCYLLGCLRFAATQDCVAILNGVELSNDDWQFGIAMDKVDDTAAPQTPLARLELENVNSVTLNSVKYLELKTDIPGEITIVLNDNFVNFEKDEISASLGNILKFICADGNSRDLGLTGRVTLTNNNEPTFEDQNNPGGAGFYYKLPMPFPKSVSVTSAYHAIAAVDIDIGNNNITFTLDGDSEGNFEVFWERSDASPKTRHFANIRSTRLLELNAPLNFNIVATDSDNPPKSTSVAVVIEVDEENSSPRIPKFSSPLYTVEISDPELPPGVLVTIPDVITVESPPEGDVTVKILSHVGGAAGLEKFFEPIYDPVSETVQISLLEGLKEEVMERSFLVFILEVTSTSFKAETVLHIALPPVEEITTTSEPTASPTVTTEDIQTTTTTEATGSTDPNGSTTESSSCPPCICTTDFSSTTCEPCSTSPFTCEPCNSSPFTCEPCNSSPFTCEPCNTSPTTCEPCTTWSPSSSTLFSSTLMPTDPPFCPTCAPCATTTTPAPSTNIAFKQSEYSATVDALYVGEVFNVEAELKEGVTGTIEYNLEISNEYLKTRLSMEPERGVLSLTRTAAPGSYMFRVTATIKETGEQATAGASVDVRSVGQCEDGKTCFPFALIAVDVAENTAREDVIPGSGPEGTEECTFIKESEVPETGWFALNETTGQLSISDLADREDPMFEGMNRAEVRLKLRLQCGASGAGSGLSMRSSRVTETTTREEMVVMVTITDLNDNAPVFEPTNLVVAYPDRKLARQLLPGPIATVKATDPDEGLSGKVAYFLESDMVKVHRESGTIYPVDGKFDYEHGDISVAASDNDGGAGANSMSTNLQWRVIGEDGVAVLTVSNAVLEDVSAILERINTELELSWGVMKAAVIADTPEQDHLPAALRQRVLRHHVLQRRTRATKEEGNGGLLMVVYALDNLLQPKLYEELKSLLSTLPEDPGTTWKVTQIETWESSGGGNSGGSNGGGNSVETANTATIVLGVLVGLLVIIIAVVVYFTVFRKRRQNQINPHNGVKNRTSFSNHKESIVALENKKNKDNDLSPGWTDPENQDDERRKSMVTFSDEPEVIPMEEARL